VSSARLLRVSLPAFSRSLATSTHAASNYPLQTQDVTNQPVQKSALEYISAVPPIEVDGTMAVCFGGSDIPALGHPAEYIQLNKVDVSQPETCKYCGLRYVMKHDHGHH